jgi:hypothetical protein
MGGLPILTWEPLMNYLRLSRAEFRNEVTYMAKTCAYLRFQRDNPNALDCDAYTYADDNWLDYVDVTLDFMAILQADQEPNLPRPSMN